MATEKSTETRAVVSAGLAIIEKISEVRWTLQLAQAVLFADLALLWKTGHGILEWFTSTDQLLGNSGILAVSVLVFGIFAAIILPIVAELFRQLLIIVPLPNWLQTEPDFKRHLGYVRPTELLDLALKENSAFLLGMYKEHTERQAKEWAAQFAAGNLVFAVLLLGIADFASNWLGLPDTSVVGELRVILGELGNFILAAAVFLAFMALKWSWFSAQDSGWIYYPPLYEEIVSKRREQMFMSAPPHVNHLDSYQLEKVKRQ